MNRPERTYNDNDLFPPLLISLDEFNRIGKIPAILNGLMTLRSRGITFLLLMQSLASLDLTYGELWSRSILENCSMKLVLRASEPKSQELISALVGSTSMVNMSSSSSISLSSLFSPGVNWGGSKSTSFSASRRTLIFPEALATLDTVLCITPLGTFHAVKEPCYY